MSLSTATKRVFWLLLALVLSVGAATQINLATQVRGLLAVANAGTGVATAAANSVLAGPTSGGAAAYAFRALVAGDIPNLSAAILTSGTLDNARLSAVPNSALANASTTVNGQTCTLGSTCTIATGSASPPCISDGSDSALNYDGTATVLGVAPVSHVYTLTRSIYPTTLTVASVATVKPNGFVVCATTSITINGAWSGKGNPGGNGTDAFGGGPGAGGATGTTTGNSGGHFPTSNFSKLGTNGGTAGTGSGGQAAVPATGTVASQVLDNSGLAGCTGATGGKGGDATGGNTGGALRAAGLGGSLGTNIAVDGRTFTVAYAGLFFNNNTAGWSQIQPISSGCGGSTGGGAGAGDGAVGGGGGGGGGAVGTNAIPVALVAPTITVGPSGSINSDGGDGGAGGKGANAQGGNAGEGGGGAGGSGGNGAWVVWACHTCTNSGAITSAGGNGGTHGLKGAPAGSAPGNGANGNDGNSGKAGLVLNFTF